MKHALSPQARSASHPIAVLGRLAVITLIALVIPLGLSSCGPKPAAPATEAEKPPTTTQPAVPPATNAVNAAENLQRLKMEAERQGALLERSSARKSLMMEERPSMSEPASIPAAPGIPSSSKAVPDPMQIR
ncbi:MAG: hypothetical protein HZA88_14645 [Verrucomicrobia bacterium]|nr:hypothetical protein [Verrucomicrobiota bacterium]